MAPDESLWQAGARPQGVTSGTFYARFRRYLRAAGLAPTGVHVLRHTAAKLRRDAGESIEDVSLSSPTLPRRGDRDRDPARDRRCRTAVRGHGRGPGGASPAGGNARHPRDRQGQGQAGEASGAAAQAAQLGRHLRQRVPGRARQDHGHPGRPPRRRPHQEIRRVQGEGSCPARGDSRLRHPPGERSSAGWSSSGSW